MEYRIVDSAEAGDIAKLAVCLIDEIMERTGERHFNVNVSLAVNLCENYFIHDIYTVFAAVERNRIVGFGSICESHSLYAEGAFGIIQEFYVMPEFRSREVGKGLIEAVIAFGKKKEWKRLELCTPPLPEFAGSLKFYMANGFEVTGGYKMRYTLTQ